MITPEEVAAVADRFGVPAAQVWRDHLISHVLAALADLPGSTDPPLRMFFGGTALCRTWCPDIRLSEDIDLFIHSPATIDTLLTTVSSGLRREHPGHSWNSVRVRHQVDTRLLSNGTADVQVQFVWDRSAWERLPVTMTSVALRYSDLPDDVILPVPTPAAFAALKLSAWLDRAAPRDLFDLAALAERGHLGCDALRLLGELTGGSHGAGLMGSTVPRSTIAEWQAELGHQVDPPRSPTECFAVVVDALVGAA